MICNIQQPYVHGKPGSIWSVPFWPVVTSLFDFCKYYIEISKVGRNNLLYFNHQISLASILNKKWNQEIAGEDIYWNLFPGFSF